MKQLIELGFNKILWFLLVVRRRKQMFCSASSSNCLLFGLFFFIFPLVFLFSSAPEKHFGVESPSNPFPHQLGGMFWEDGGLRERGSGSERDAASVRSSGQSASTRTHPGKLHGLLVEPLIHPSPPWRACTPQIHLDRHAVLLNSRDNKNLLFFVLRICVSVFWWGWLSRLSNMDCFKG